MKTEHWTGEMPCSINGFRNFEFLNHNYYSITESVEHLYNHIKTNNDNNLLVLFVKIAIYYLNFVFTRVEGGRRNTFIWYTIPVIATPEVVKYRKILLNELKHIYCEGKYNEEIEGALTRYCSGHTEYIDYNIVNEEYGDILSILAVLNVDNLYHCSIVAHIKQVFEDAEIEYDHDFVNRFIESDKNKIFCTLKGNRNVCNVVISIPHRVLKNSM